MQLAKKKDVESMIFFRTFCKVPFFITRENAEGQGKTPKKI